MRASTLVRAAVIISIAVALATVAAACGSKTVVREVTVEVTKEVPVEVVVEVPVPYVVEVIKEVPVEVVVEVPVIVEREVAGPTMAVSSSEAQSQDSATTASTIGQTTDTVAASLAEPESSGPTRFYIGGQARLMSTLEGLIDVDPDEPVAETFRIDILIDEQNRYYFTSDKPLVAPSGERVKFVVYNTHFTPDECW